VFNEIDERSALREILCGTDKLRFAGVRRSDCVNRASLQIALRFKETLILSPVEGEAIMSLLGRAVEEVEWPAMTSISS
jgi:hypothetical protein